MLRCVFPFNGFGEECKLSVSHNIVEGKPSALYLDPGSCGVAGRRRTGRRGSLLPCCTAVPPEEWGEQHKRNAAVQFGGKG